jgi:hypothetical protein
MGSSETVRDLGVALIAAGVSVGAAALVVLHALPTGLSPVRDAVSRYGITEYRAGYRVQTIAYGLAGMGAAVGIATMPGPTAIVVALCCLFAASRLAISWFPMDVPGGEPTTHGRRHLILAATAFVAVAVAARQLSRLLDHDGIDPRIAGASTVLAVLMVVTLVAIGIDRRAGGRHFGLVERCFYVCMTTWLVVVAALLLSR